MSEADFKRDFDANFFASWGDAMGGLSATYISVGGTETQVDVLVDTGIVQFGDDLSPVSSFRTYLTFRRAQVEPEAQANVVVGGVSYLLVQRVDSSDESLSRWAVQHG